MTQDNRDEKLRRDGSETKSIQGHRVSKNKGKKRDISVQPNSHK